MKALRCCNYSLAATQLMMPDEVSAGDTSEVSQTTWIETQSIVQTKVSDQYIIYHLFLCPM